MSHKNKLSKAQKKEHLQTRKTFTCPWCNAECMPILKGFDVEVSEHNVSVDAKCNRCDKKLQVQLFVDPNWDTQISW